MKYMSIVMMTTGELLTQMKELKETCNSRGCSYEDWLDLQLRIDSIDEELMQRALDEQTDRYTDVDEHWDGMNYYAQWESNGFGYDEDVQ
jgi:hypothetical protein